RLVIDLPEVRVSGNRTFDTEAELISSVRVGAHPDKSRIVIDLADERDIENSVERIVDGLVVTVARREISLPNVEYAQTQPSIIEEQPMAQPSLPAVEPEAFAAADVEDPLVTLTGVSLENVGHDSNVLVAELSANSEYTL